jgi:hypothetical protein
VTVLVTTVLLAEPGDALLGAPLVVLVTVVMTHLHINSPRGNDLVPRIEAHRDLRVNATGSLRFHSRFRGAAAGPPQTAAMGTDFEPRQ